MKTLLSLILVAIFATLTPIQAEDSVCFNTKSAINNNDCWYLLYRIQNELGISADRVTGISVTVTTNAAPDCSSWWNTNGTPIMPTVPPPNAFFTIMYFSFLGAVMVIIYTVAPKPPQPSMTGFWTNYDGQVIPAGYGTYTNSSGQVFNYGPTSQN